MKNNQHESFLGCVKKVDSTNIILKYKPEGICNGEIFLLRKKDMLWTFALFVTPTTVLSISLQVGQTLSTILEFTLLPTFKDILRTILFPANIF